MKIFRLLQSLALSGMYEVKQQQVISVDLWKTGYGSVKIGYRFVFLSAL